MRDELAVEQILSPLPFFPGVFEVDLRLFKGRLAAQVAGFVLLDFGLQNLLVDFGHDLAGRDDGIEIGVKLDDLARNLAPDFDDVDGIDGTRGDDQGLDVAPGQGFRPVRERIVLAFLNKGNADNQDGDSG